MLFKSPFWRDFAIALQIHQLLPTPVPDNLYMKQQQILKTGNPESKRHFLTKSQIATQLITKVGKRLNLILGKCNNPSLDLFF